MAKRGLALVDLSALPEQKTKTQGLSVEIKNVSHSYELHGAKLPVLENITFSIQSGKSTALVGPSGCGKSTLLRLLAGLDLPLEGEISVDGQVVCTPAPERGLVFQDPTLYPWLNIWNNIALGLQARGLLAANHKRVDETLKLVGLEAFSKAHPHQLSGGMAQRVALARALVNNPRLLLLDEPLGKLDSLTRMAMQAELVTLWRTSGFTVLLVTHDVEEALLLSDTVLVLGPRPASIIGEVRNDLPYPRHREDPELQRLRNLVFHLLEPGAKDLKNLPVTTSLSDTDASVS
jgi:NitT/TauT family transport system ATP-binding protein